MAGYWAQMETPSSSQIELDIADVTRGDDGIIRIIFHPTPSHDLLAAKEVVAAHNSLAEGVPCGVLADIRNVTVGADRQARQYYTTEEASYLKSAMAMVVTSPVQQMLGNIFFLLSRPPYPTRMFKSEASAVGWLRTFEREA